MLETLLKHQVSKDLDKSVKAQESPIPLLLSHKLCLLEAISNEVVHQQQPANLFSTEHLPVFQSVLFSAAPLL